MDLLITILLVLVGLATALFYWLWRNDAINAAEFAKRNVKYVKQGNMLKSMFVQEQIQLSKHKAIKREGPVFGFTLVNTYTILIADVDLIQTVLVKDFTKFSNRREFPLFDKILANNLFFVSDEKWKRIRSTVTPAFSVGKLKAMKPFMDQTITTMLRNIDSKLQSGSSNHNVKDIFSAFTMDTIIRIAFGVQVDSINDPNNPIIIHGKSFFSTEPKLFDLLKMALVFMIPKLGQFLNLSLMNDAQEFFTKLSTDIMNEKRTEFGKGKSSEQSKAISFLECMLEAEQENEMNAANDIGGDAKKPTKFMTTDEIVAQAVIFFLAGFETTATALSLAAYNLAQHPDKQERLFEEINAVIEKLQLENATETDLYKLVSYDAIQSKFEYLNAVVNETMRLDTTVIFIERTATVDTELRNADGSVLSIKKDDVIQIPTWSVHRDSKYFSEPEKFIPERFLGEPTFPKNAFFPFGAGPRNCIARSMGQLETRLALLHVVRNYRFELCPETKVEFVNQFDLIVPKQVVLRIVKR